MYTGSYTSQFDINLNQLTHTWVELGARHGHEVKVIDRHEVEAKVRLPSQGGYVDKVGYYQHVFSIAMLVNLTFDSH